MLRAFVLSILLLLPFGAQAETLLPDLDLKGIIRVHNMRFDVTFHRGMFGGSWIEKDENGQDMEVFADWYGTRLTVTARYPHTLEDTDEKLALDVAYRFCDENHLKRKPEPSNSRFEDVTWIFEDACE